MRVVWIRYPERCCFSRSLIRRSRPAMRLEARYRRPAHGAGGSRRCTGAQRRKGKATGSEIARQTGQSPGRSIQLFYRVRDVQEPCERRAVVGALRDGSGGYKDKEVQRPSRRPIRTSHRGVPILGRHALLGSSVLTSLAPSGDTCCHWCTPPKRMLTLHPHECL